MGAVSLALMLTGKLPFAEGLGYVASQVIGAIIAGLVCFHSIHDEEVFNGTMATKVHAGYPNPSAAWGTYAIVPEILGTMTLVLVVLNTCTCSHDKDGNITDARANTQASFFGLVIGSVLTVWVTVAGGISGGAMNPAIGPLPVAWGKLDHVWLYWVGDLTGSILGVLIFIVTNPYEMRLGLIDPARKLPVPAWIN